ncbi:ferredoxin--NADP(+) reductase [Acinetobacter pittii]|jgi:ferredoxin--NADP+ reductase|uniref:ferredoxin--NADP(+) reductase n=2 Tax=Acinetobacter pittii TaxID=48296 RepID=F0KEU0_ACIP2|nr:MULTISPECIES: ferredoxin--NADP reductase [Acinetobacter]YP_004994302.1 ferredoxin--NADP+ reductase [Acinetobacter pittii PHEA-2]AMO41587.1 ferredoxin--NADP(+) reductase [Acinetobacter sp. DUT-2]KCY66883.1 oxidoreductase NAD-binding domain protein [Acinetobacter baumannii 1288284]QNB03297.1 ferredoxin--NADP reductase [Acinetobacter baumannii]ADY80620.1 ferredoxin--NADP+ reductase [Acinetobacter pittii PHEA-2]AUT35381.1 ferredoxin--NADP reductase [Acinetobacter pittii]
MSIEKFSVEKVLSVHRWTPTLFSFTMTRPAHFKFTAGQFARIGLKVGEELVVRAYSVVSSPFDETLEFFSIVVPDGAFTSNLQHLKVGDELYLEKIPYGYLTLARYQQPLPHDLWLLATGTGLAPFLSMLQDFDTWSKYQKINLVYSVRTAAELAYVDRIQEIAETFGEGHNGFKFIPIITRDPSAPLHDRLPILIENGELEKSAGIELNPATSHVMLCGNPQMVDDTKEALKRRGLTMNRRGEGNIAVENYW